MKKMIFIACMVICMLISIFGLGKYCTDAKHFEKTIASLDEKKDNVLALTGGTTGLSIAITCIPGDVATPIAEKLADLSSIFLAVLCAIFLEKYMLTITGLITFKYLLPIAFALFGINVFARNATIGKLAMKLMLFGIAIFAIVPISVNISNVIEKNYDVSVQDTIQELESLSDEITGSSSTETVESDTNSNTNSDSAIADQEDDKSWWEKAADTLTGVKDSVSNVADKVENTITKAQSGELLKEAKEQLNNIIEAAAVMLITSCVIPILIIVAFGWVIRMILEVDVNLGSIGKKILPKGFK